MTRLLVLVFLVVGASNAAAQDVIRIVPQDGITIAAGQRLDLRVEATSSGSMSAKPPSLLTVSLNGRDITSRNQLEPGDGGERGAGPRIAPNPWPWAAFAQQTRKPRAVMPPYSEKNLSDQDLADIYAYMRSIPAQRAAKDIPELSNF